MILKFCRNIRLRQESHGSAQVLKCRIWALNKKNDLCGTFSLDVCGFVEVWKCVDFFNFGCVEVLRCVSVNECVVRVWKCVAEKAANWRRRVIPRDFSSLSWQEIDLKEEVCLFAAWLKASGVLCRSGMDDETQVSNWWKSHHLSFLQDCHFHHFCYLFGISTIHLFLQKCLQVIITHWDVVNQEESKKYGSVSFITCFRFQILISLMFETVLDSFPFIINACLTRPPAVHSENDSARTSRGGRAGGGRWLQRVGAVGWGVDGWCVGAAQVQEAVEE